MNPGCRNRIFKIGCGILAVIGIIIALFIASYSSRITNMVHTIEPAFRQIDRTPVEALGPGARAVSFPNEEGVYVPGWYREGDNGAAIIFLHGLGGTRMQLVNIARRFIDQGYSVLLIDQRGHGEHPGKVTTFGRAESIDALASVNWLREQPGVDSDKIGMYGASMGAATCIHAAARDAESGENKIACAVADSSYADLTSQAYHDLSREETPVQLPVVFRPLAVRIFMLTSRLVIGKWAGYPDPIDDVGKIKCPLFLIHGDCDTRISPDSFDRLTEAARDADVDLETWRVSDGEHCAYHDSEEFIRRLTRFFAEHLLNRQML
jgi:dipeptidyl aminopeptidase/acylaminoacyl peptidase